MDSNISSVEKDITTIYNVLDEIKQKQIEYETKHNNEEYKLSFFQGKIIFFIILCL